MFGIWCWAFAQALACFSVFVLNVVGQSLFSILTMLAASATAINFLSVQNRLPNKKAGPAGPAFLFWSGR
jgi:hypothetical protein